MAATGRNVPFAVLVRRDRRRARRGPDHSSIPPGSRRVRARHCVCGFRLPVDTCGSVRCRAPARTACGFRRRAKCGRRPAMGRRDLRRGAVAGGESTLALRSCQGEAASRAGGVLCPGATGRVRVSTQRALAARVGKLSAGRAVPGAPHARPRGVLVARHRPPSASLRLDSPVPPVLVPGTDPVNALSGHTDERVGHPAAPALGARVACLRCVTKTSAVSHMSRVRGPSVTPGRQPLAGPRSLSFTDHRLGDRQRGARLPLTAAPAAAVARAGRCTS